MKDIIWTLIIIWLIYRIASVFKKSDARQNKGGSIDQTSQPQKQVKKNSAEVLNKEGEYVEYEEVK